ncbi:MAG: hypothetical protein ACRD0J_18920 [Acidimicrobiales bacterium]
MRNTASSVWSPDPSRRLEAASSLPDRRRRRLLARAGGWPDGSAGSAGSANAWLLLVSTKAPTWSDALVSWQDLPPTLGRPHPGLFHPDRLGFWSEVRKWSIELLAPRVPGRSAADLLALTAVVAVGDDPRRAAAARALTRPGMVLGLDEGAAATAGLSPRARSAVAVGDPYRTGQRYQGWWGVEADGTVVGKAPQHPAANRLYLTSDLLDFLAAAPVPGQEPAAGLNLVGATGTGS